MTLFICAIKIEAVPANKPQDLKNPIVINDVQDLSAADKKKSSRRAKSIKRARRRARLKNPTPLNNPIPPSKSDLKATPNPKAIAFLNKIQNK